MALSVTLIRLSSSFLFPDNIPMPSLIAGVDYIAVNQTLTFPGGAAVGNGPGRQCFLVQTTEDLTREADESLQLTLASGSPSFLLVQTGRGTATVIILDDDGNCLVNRIIF